MYRLTENTTSAEDNMESPFWTQQRDKSISPQVPDSLQDSHQDLPGVVSKRNTQAENSGMVSGHDEQHVEYPELQPYDNDSRCDASLEYVSCTLCPHCHVVTWHTAKCNISTCNACKGFKCPNCEYSVGVGKKKSAQMYPRIFCFTCDRFTTNNRTTPSTVLLISDAASDTIRSIKRSFLDVFEESIGGGIAGMEDVVYDGTTFRCSQLSPDSPMNLVPCKCKGTVPASTSPKARGGGDAAAAASHKSSASATDANATYRAATSNARSSPLNKRTKRKSRMDYSDLAGGADQDGFYAEEDDDGAEEEYDIGNDEPSVSSSMKTTMRKRFIKRRKTASQDDAVPRPSTPRVSSQSRALSKQKQYAADITTKTANRAIQSSMEANNGSTFSDFKKRFPFHVPNTHLVNFSSSHEIPLELTIQLDDSVQSDDIAERVRVWLISDKQVWFGEGEYETLHVELDVRSVTDESIVCVIPEMTRPDGIVGQYRERAMRLGFRVVVELVECPISIHPSRSLFSLPSISFQLENKVEYVWVSNEPSSKRKPSQRRSIPVNPSLPGSTLENSISGSGTRAIAISSHDNIALAAQLLRMNFTSS